MVIYGASRLFDKVAGGAPKRAAGRAKDYFRVRGAAPRLFPGRFAALWV